VDRVQPQPHRLSPLRHAAAHRRDDVVTGGMWAWPSPSPVPPQPSRLAVQSAPATSASRPEPVRPVATSVGRLRPAAAGAAAPIDLRLRLATADRVWIAGYLRRKNSRAKAGQRSSGAAAVWRELHTTSAVPTTTAHSATATLVDASSHSAISTPTPTPNTSAGRTTWRGALALRAHHGSRSTLRRGQGTRSMRSSSPALPEGAFFHPRDGSGRRDIDGCYPAHRRRIGPPRF
jgi:hypothetical protein